MPGRSWGPSAIRVPGSPEKQIDAGHGDTPVRRGDHSTDDERTSRVLPETRQGHRCRRHSNRGRGRLLRHRQRNLQQQLRCSQHGNNGERGIQRSVWAGLRGNIRQGRQRVHVELHTVDISGSEGTIDEASSTNYQKGASSASASAITAGESVLVLGVTSGTTITATQVIVQPTGGGSATSSAGVIPFQRGAPSPSKQVGQIPSNYSQGSGTIVGGTTANKATEAALAAYSGGIVDRVVKLSNGEFQVHYIGVNWPHHIFVSKNFKVIGAD